MTAPDAPATPPEGAAPTVAESLEAAALMELERLDAAELDAADRALDAARAAGPADGKGSGTAVDAALAGAVAAYRGGGFARRLAAAHGALVALHTTMDGLRDVRCRTCRTPRGRPAPWPCVTLVEVRAAMGLSLPINDVERLRDWGRIRNGTAPRTAWGRHVVQVCRAGHPPHPPPDLADLAADATTDTAGTAAGEGARHGG